MLDIDRETIDFILTRMRAFQVQEWVSFPEETEDTGHSVAQILSSHQEDPSYQEVIKTIDDLEPEQQAELVALMWLGRGDYDLSEWESAVGEASRSFGNENVGHYLLARPQASEFLQEGLNQMREAEEQERE